MNVSNKPGLVGLQRIERNPDQSFSPKDVLKAVTEEVALKGTNPHFVHHDVTGVALENNHVVLYAPDAFVQKKGDDGVTYGPSDSDLEGQFKMYSQITQVDIFVSRGKAPAEAANLLEQTRKDLLKGG
jgi:hypothetical protein